MHFYDIPKCLLTFKHLHSVATAGMYTKAVHMGPRVHLQWALLLFQSCVIFKVHPTYLTILQANPQNKSIFVKERSQVFFSVLVFSSRILTYSWSQHEESLELSNKESVAHGYVTERKYSWRTQKEHSSRQLSMSPWKYMITWVSSISFREQWTSNGGLSTAEMPPSGIYVWNGWKSNEGSMVLIL